MPESKPQHRPGEHGTWESRQFFGTRIDILRERLNKTNRAKFETLTYDQQCAIVARLIEKGSMI